MRKDGENESANLAWQMFERTGSISYYMLYHQLRKK